MADADFATAQDVVGAWHSLTSDQQQRAEYWIGVASRRIRRRWPDIDQRIALGHPSADEVRDIVVQLVIPVLAALEAPAGARSFQVSSGSESRQVVLGEEARVELPDFDAWMLDLLDGTTTTSTARPVGAFPRPGRYDHIFEWQEDQR